MPFSSPEQHIINTKLAQAMKICRFTGDHKLIVTPEDVHRILYTDGTREDVLADGLKTITDVVSRLQNIIIGCSIKTDAFAQKCEYAGGIVKQDDESGLKDVCSLLPNDIKQYPIHRATQSHYNQVAERIGEMQIRDSDVSARHHFFAVIDVPIGSNYAQTIIETDRDTLKNWIAERGTPIQFTINDNGEFERETRSSPITPLIGVGTEYRTSRIPRGTTVHLYANQRSNHDIRLTSNDYVRRWYDPAESDVDAKRVAAQRFINTHPNDPRNRWLLRTIASDREI